MLNIKKSSYLLSAVIILLLAAVIFVENASRDKKSPEITIKGQEIEINVADGEDVMLQGVTAEDNADGDLTDMVVVENISDFHSDGSRTVTYAVSDSSNNVAKAERKITYKDYTPPQFRLSSDLTFYSSNTSINIANAVTATDMIDGDITPFIKLIDENIVVGQGGEYYAEVSVYNSAGDCSSIKLPVFIESFVANPSAPEIELSDYLIYVDAGSVTPDWSQYVESVKKQSNTSETVDKETYMETLNIDDSNVDLNTAGTYYVTFEYTGSNDLTAITRLTVEVR